jgi:uncharacterized protein YgiM (DUF1202 family)
MERYMFGLSKRVVGVVGALVVVGLLFLFKDPGHGSGRGGGGCATHVKADTLNVRSAPNGHSEVVGKYANGDWVDVQQVVKSGFRKIDANHWVAQRFLSDC